VVTASFVAPARRVLSFEVQLGHERGDAPFVRPEPRGAEVEATIARPHRQQATTDPVTRFEHHDRPSGVMEQASGSKAGRAGPNDQDIDRCGIVHVASLKVVNRSHRHRGLIARLTLPVAPSPQQQPPRRRLDLHRRAVRENDKSPGQVFSAIYQGIQMVGTTGLEPATSTVSWISNRTLSVKLIDWEKRWSPALSPIR